MPLKRTRKKPPPRKTVAFRCREPLIEYVEKEWEGDEPTFSAIVEAIVAEWVKRDKNKKRHRRPEATTNEPSPLDNPGSEP